MVKQQETKNAADETFSYDQACSIALDIYDPELKALFAIEFLTGARVGEIVRRLKKKQITLRMIKDKQFLLFEDVYTEKNPKHPCRTMPVPYEQEKELCDIVLNYMKIFSPHDLLFSWSRQTAWLKMRIIIIKYKELSLKATLNANHFMRHSRNTDLIKRYGFTDYELKRWHGWATIKHALTYEHLRYVDLAEKMM